MMQYQYILSNIFSRFMMDFSFQSSKMTSVRNHQGHLLYDVDQLEQKSVAALRASFVHWIRSLLMEERFLALKIYSYPIPQVIRKLFIKVQTNFNGRGFEMHSLNQSLTAKDEKCSDLKKVNKKIQKGFYDAIVFVSDGQDYFDHICFEYGLLECPEKLFDLLVAPVENPSAKLFLEAVKNRKNSQKVSQKLLECQTLQEITRQTINFLRQQILIRFRESILDSDFIPRSLQQQKKRKKQFSIYFKHLSEDLKRKLILLGNKDIQELQEWLVKQEIKLDFQEVEKEISQLMKLQKNQFCNRIFKCKLKKVNNQIISFHQQIYLYWKKEVSKNKKKKFAKNISNEKIEKQVSHNIKAQQKQTKNIQAKKTYINSHKKSNSVESNETNVTERGKRTQKSIDPEQSKKYLEKQFSKIKQKQQVLEKESQLKIKNTEIVHKKRSNKKRKNRNDKQISQIEKHQSKNLHQQKQEQTIKISNILYLRKDKLVKQIKQQLIAKSYQIPNQIPVASNNLLKELHYSRMSQQLQDFADKISQQANIYHDRRLIAFQRIQVLLNYYNINIVLFGSCASGIAIKNSDIDIAVKSQILSYFQYLPQNIRLLGALQNLQQIFMTQPFITSINLISTASIPIIKLKIDTSKSFLDENYGQIFYQLNRPHNSGIIETDITIETINYQSQSNHLGIISTQAINEWLQQIPTLHCIIITLKQFFEKKGFNVTYKGGLNTFSLLVLMVSYIYHANLKKQTNPALVLEQILKFYAYQFNQRQKGIDLLGLDSNIFYNKKQSNDTNNDGREKADLEILDPKCHQKNITKKCYLFSQIKLFFKEMLENCFELSQKQLQKIVFQDKQNDYNKTNDVQQLSKTLFEKINYFDIFYNRSNNQS